MKIPVSSTSAHLWIMQIQKLFWNSYYVNASVSSNTSRIIATIQIDYFMIISFKAFSQNEW